MDKVYKNLWIGDIDDAREEPLGDFGIQRVITVCQDSVSDNIGCDYTHYNMSDGPDNKYGGDHSYEIYQEATDDLFNYLQSGDKVLIHCHKGQSRSVSVAVGAISRLKGISPSEALDLIENNRPEVDPDDLLIQHAEKYVSTDG